MNPILDYLKSENISPSLLEGIEQYRADYPVPEKYAGRIPKPEYIYYGIKTWEKALAAILAGKNLLLAGPKATGKNVLSDNLCAIFGRPSWNVSFHINMDASYLIGTDTYDGNKVIFRPGPVYLAASEGGFCVLDEINMAKNEALAVLHAALDYRHIIDVPGYDKIDLHPACRFIATMNYGYAGTRDLNEALSSRFVVLQMEPINEADLIRLIKYRFNTINDSYALQFAKLFIEIDAKARNAEISERALDLRGLMDAIELIQKGLCAGDALEMCIINKNFDQYERGLVRDVINARIRATLRSAAVFRA